MKKKILPLALSVCILMSGCASLLDRSYSSIEPYTDRYWDSGAEDTLKAESYQDLVNSLLMLIEQRSEEGVIRYYVSDGSDGYAQALSAKQEVRNETLLGAYLLESLTVSYAQGDSYCTLTYIMRYREDAQDISTLMDLSDSQSLVDLLRMAMREGHESLTAKFISKMSREEIMEAVNQLWQELYLDELEERNALMPPEDETLPDKTEAPPDEGGEGDADAEAEPPAGDETAQPNEGESAEEGGTPPETPEDPEVPEDGEPGTEPGESEEPEEIPPEPEIVFPPCPWEIVFYPNEDAVEIVEIILK